MSRKIVKNLNSLNFASNAADALNLSEGNVLRDVTDPAHIARNAYIKGGDNAYIDYFRKGGMTDPFYILHYRDAPKVGDPGQVEQQDAVQAGLSARDRVRRAAYRAQGRQSTIKVNATSPYTGQPATLLGG